MTPIEALNFYHALSMDYVQTALNGRKATQMSVLSKMQEAQQALARVVAPRDIAEHTEADKDAGNDADSG